MQQIQYRIAVVSQAAHLLGGALPVFPELEPIKIELDLLASVLNMLSDVQTSIERYKQRTWKELRFDAVAQDMAAYAAAAR
jgi:hypothetical protein